MKKIFLTMACACSCCTASWAQFGKCTPSERWTYTDAQTGNEITVLTDTLKNDRFLYQTDPCGRLMVNICCSVLPAEGTEPWWNVRSPMEKRKSGSLPRFIL